MIYSHLAILILGKKNDNCQSSANKADVHYSSNSITSFVPQHVLPVTHLIFRQRPSFNNDATLKHPLEKARDEKRLVFPTLIRLPLNNNVAV